MVHKVIVPAKKIMSHSFLNSGTLLKWFFVKSFMLCLEISNSVMPRMGSCPPLSSLPPQGSCTWGMKKDYFLNIV
jgi:hypothetical protein